MVVAGVIWPAIAALAAAVLPVSAVVPAMLAATFVIFVAPDSHHTLNEPFAARMRTNFLVARTTVPRSKASLLCPRHISVSRLVFARREKYAKARACDHEKSLRPALRSFTWFE